MKKVTLLALSAVLAGCSIFGKDEKGDEFFNRVRSGEQNRSYYGYAPNSFKDGRSALVIAFHGAFDVGSNFREGSGLNDLADDLGALVLYPNSSGEDWAEGCNCSNADRDSINDVQFMYDIAEDIRATYSYDTSRVYVVGFSQGGLFAQRVACEESEFVQAVVVVGATISVPLKTRCQPSDEVAVMMAHGKEDEFFPWLGGGQGNFATEGALRTIDLWGDLNGCEGRTFVQVADDAKGSETERWRFNACAEGKETVLYGFRNTAHEWPRRHGIVKLIQDFFSRAGAGTG